MKFAQLIINKLKTNKIDFCTYYINTTTIIALRGTSRTLTITISEYDIVLATNSEYYNNIFDDCKKELYKGGNPFKFGYLFDRSYCIETHTMARTIADLLIILDNYPQHYPDE